MEPVSIVRACSTDAPGIAKLGAFVFAKTFGHSVPPDELQAFLNASYTVEAIKNDLQDPTRDIIIATNPQHDILGFAYLTRGTSEPCVDHLEDKVELQRIYVDLKAHGQGIGWLLANSIEAVARGQGFKRIWLGVWEENFNAIKAYERWGYERVGQHDFVIGSIVQTDYIMLKSLLV